MAEPSRVIGDVVFADDVTFVGTAALPDGTVTNAAVNASAAIAASKLVHRYPLSYSQANGADVASQTMLLHVMRAAGEVVSIEARVTTAPTGGDKAFTVDVLKAADGSGSWTSLLSSVITFNSSDSNDTLEVGTLIGSPTLADGNAIRVVVSASGSTGSQGQGLVVTVNVNENPS